ncbi:hypothetical protein IW262DRAFT_1465184 [Armillaria fumosa]|nr:hypothetical protein IW262DRAFT_1465184 [Armillaria fumosa]
MRIPLSSCLSHLEEEPAGQDSNSPKDIVVVLGIWAGFSTCIQDLAQSLPAAYHRGLVRLPQAVMKPICQLAHMDSQKQVDLVEALVSWHLVDELLCYEGINDGEFTINYQATFKPLVKLTQWVACLADWPSVLLSAIGSQESHCIETGLPSLPEGTQLSTEQKDLWQDLLAACSWNCCGHMSYWQKLLHLIEGVAWQLRWMRCTRGDPEGYGSKLYMFTIDHGMTDLWQQVQGSISTVTARNKDALPHLQCSVCCFDDRDKPAVLRSVERGLWSLLLGIAGSAFEAEEGLICFLWLYQLEIEGMAYVPNVTSWFDVTAHLRPPRGSQTTSIMVALSTVATLETTQVVLSQEEQANLQGGTAEIKTVDATNLSGEDQPLWEHISIKEKPTPKKKKTKKKSKESVIEDDGSETHLSSVGTSGSNQVKHHKPPPFRLSKSELLVYTQNGADDEDSTWQHGFLQVNHTKGPMMGAYSETVKILPLFWQRSVLVTNVPQHARKWGWNGWTVRELGNLDMPIEVHKPIWRFMDASFRLARLTVQIASTLQSVLNEGLKGKKGRVLNALTLPMPNTTLQSPLFHQVASHLEACKVTRSIGSDLLTAPFPVAALSWGLASVAGAVTPPHSNFGGSVVKIQTLMGCKIWFVISKCQEDERCETWDTFVWDFQADSKVNSDMYQCEVVLVEPGTLWFQHLNMLHAVAMESNSLVFGQHFFPASAIHLVVMGWVHTAFLSWAITNVEHKDMRVLLLCLMAYWKKVIMAGENLEEHDGHVPNIEMQEGLLDVCALGNLLIYLPALSRQQDKYWDDL